MNLAHFGTIAQNGDNHVKSTPIAKPEKMNAAFPRKCRSPWVNQDSSRGRTPGSFAAAMAFATSICRQKTLSPSNC